MRSPTWRALATAGFSILLGAAYFVTPLFVLEFLTLGALFWTPVVYLWLFSLAAQNPLAALCLVGYAALCLGLGWLTVSRGGRARPYEDALHGHTFEELAELLATQNRPAEVSETDRTHNRR